MIVDEPHYKRWQSMKSRCFWPKSKSWKYYGGRGIGVCKEWMNFRTFQAWCLKTYKAGMSIDRIDNDKGYSPDNCRWATRSQQALNQTRSAEYFEMKRKNIAKSINDKRIKKYGDPKTRKNKICFGCKIKKPVKDFGINRNRIDGRQYICRTCRALREKKKQHDDNNQ